MKSFCCLANKANYVEIIVQVLLINHFHPEASIYIYYAGISETIFTDIKGLLKNVILKNLPENTVIINYYYFLLYCLQDILKDASEVVFVNTKAFICGPIKLNAKTPITFLKDDDNKIYTQFIHCNSREYIIKLTKTIDDEGISLCKKVLYDSTERNKIFNDIYAATFKKYSNKEENAILRKIKFDEELLEKLINEFFDEITIFNIEKKFTYIENIENIGNDIMDENTDEAEKIKRYIYIYFRSVLNACYNKNIYQYVKKDDYAIIDETSWHVYNLLSPELRIIDDKLTFKKNDLSFIFPVTYTDLKPDNPLLYTALATKSNFDITLQKYKPLYTTVLELQTKKHLNINLNINTHALIKKKWGIPIELFNLWNEISSILHLGYYNTQYCTINNMLIYNYFNDSCITPEILKYKKIINMGFINKEAREILTKNNQTIINFMYPTKYPQFLDKYIIDNNKLPKIDNAKILNNYILDETDAIEEQDYIKHIEHISQYKFIVPNSNADCKEVSYQLLEACALGIVPILISDTIDTDNFYNPLIKDIHFIKADNLEDAQNKLSLMNETKMETIRKACKKWYMNNIYYKNSLQLFYKILLL
jgi:hypothetical protein